MPVQLLLEITQDSIALVNVYELSRQGLHANNRYKFVWPFQGDELHRLHMLLDNAVTQDSAEQSAELIYEFGEKLRRALLYSDPGFIGLFTSATTRAQWQGGLCLQLMLHPSVAAAPWEYMNERLPERGRRFMAIEDGASIVRVRQIHGQSPPPSKNDHLRILVVAIPAGSGWQPIDADGMLEQFLQPFAELIEQGSVSIDVIKGTQPTLDAIRTHLNRQPYTIIHILGHGRYGDPNRASSSDRNMDRSVQGGLLMAYDRNGKYVPVAPEQLAAILRTPCAGQPDQSADPTVRLAVLMNCAGARTLTLDGFSDIASHLAGVIPSVIAMQSSIGQATAQKLTVGLYMHLATAYQHAGAHVAAALNTARRALLADRESTLEMGVPILYQTNPYDVLIARTRRPLSPGPDGRPAPEDPLDIAWKQYQSGDNAGALQGMAEFLTPSIEPWKAQVALKMIGLNLMQLSFADTRRAKEGYRSELMGHLRRLQAAHRWREIVEYAHDMPLLDDDVPIKLLPVDEPSGELDEPGASIESEQELEQIISDARYKHHLDQQLRQCFERIEASLWQHDWQAATALCSELRERDPEYRRTEREEMELAASSGLQSMLELQKRIKTLAEQEQWTLLDMIGEGPLLHELSGPISADIHDILKSAAVRIQRDASLTGALHEAISNSSPEAWARLAAASGEIAATTPNVSVATALQLFATWHMEESTRIRAIAEKIDWIDP